jgi:hypothetical protein
VVLLLEDEMLHKIPKLELHKGFAAISELRISKKRPLATSGGDSKNCHVTFWGLYVAYLCIL